MLGNIDPKKYPKRPDLLWNPNAGDQSVNTMIEIAKMWASNTNDVLKGTKH